MSKVRGEPDGSAAKREVLAEDRGGDCRPPATIKKSKRPATTGGYRLGKACRTAMGEYMVKEGQEPLTQQAKPKPGPADYHPTTELCFVSAPRYSVVGKCKLETNRHSQTPGPDKYDTSQDLDWADKTRTLKAKGKTRPYDIRPDAHMTCSIGAGGYVVEYGDTGRNSAKHSIGSRHIQGLNVGPPNTRVQPVDTHGFKTPGPDYSPNSPYWGRGPERSFGLKLEDEDPATPGPGPAGYESRENERGVSYSFGSQLQPIAGFNTPGPNVYNIGSTIGTAMAKSISGKHKEIKKDYVPSPDTYNIIHRRPQGPRHSMTYRAFESEPDKYPSPADYSPKKVPLKTSPAYSCRRSCRPCYPDILNYPKFSPMRNPGPGTHSINQDFSKNEQPAYSVGKRLKQPANMVPGPNHYHIRVECRPDSRRAPEYSMAKRLEQQHSSCEQGPGPAEYLPHKISKNPSYSMASRRRIKEVTTAPGANAYAIATGQTRHGKFTGQAATLKARASPFVYSGFDNPARLSSMV